MDKQKAIKKALEAGVLLTPEALQDITEEKLDRIIEDASQGNQAVAGTPPAEKGPSGPVLKARRTRPKAKLTAKDYADFYSSKFRALKAVLSAKLDAVSINKAAESRSEVAVIGMVKEAVQAGFLLEDTTGEIEVAYGGNDIAADDVLGVKGHVREGRLFAGAIVWPDVPLSRPMPRIAGAAVTLTECPDKAPGGSLLLSTSKAPGAQTIQSPGWATISHNGTDVSILAYTPEAGPAADAKEWLRKRCLPMPKKAIPGPSNPYIMGAVPDILWVAGGEQKKDVYKGVLVVHTGNGSATVDLGTMEAAFR